MPRLGTNGLCFNDPVIVHRTGQQRIFSTSRHNHLPTIGLQNPTILCQIIHLALGHHHTHQLVAAKSQREGIPPGQNNSS